MEPKRIKVAERIDELLKIYERLNIESNLLIDSYVDEVVAPRTPGVPKGVLRNLEFGNRFPPAANYVEILRYLRHARA
jgi:hypothetical protein